MGFDNLAGVVGLGVKGDEEDMNRKTMSVFVVGFLIVASAFYFSSVHASGPWDSERNRYADSFWWGGETAIYVINPVTGDSLFLTPVRLTVRDGSASESWVSKDSVFTGTTFSDTVATGYTLAYTVVETDSLTTWAAQWITVLDTTTFTYAVILDSTGAAGESPQLILQDGDGKQLVLQKLNAGEANIINDEGAIYVMPSNDVDDYLALSTSSNVVQISNIGGANASDDFKIVTDDGDLYLAPADALDLVPSGDTGDYISVSTVSDLPQISGIGGADGVDALKILTDDGDILVAPADTLDLDPGVGVMRIDGDVDPFTDNTRSLGSSDLRYADGFFNKISLGDTTTGDADAIIYFADDASATAEDLRWDDGLDAFSLSDELVQATAAPVILITDTDVNTDVTTQAEMVDSAAVHIYTEADGDGRIDVVAKGGDTISLYGDQNNSYLASPNTWRLDRGGTVLQWDGTSLYGDSDDLNHMGSATIRWKTARVTDNIYLGGNSQTATLYISQEGTVAGTDSSLTIYVNSGVPTIQGNATDGDQSDITWNTSDQMLFSNASGGYEFDTVILPDADEGAAIGQDGDRFSITFTDTLALGDTTWTDHDALIVAAGDGDYKLHTWGYDDGEDAWYTTDNVKYPAYEYMSGDSLQVLSWLQIRCDTEFNAATYDVGDATNCVDSLWADEHWVGSQIFPDADEGADVGNSGARFNLAYFDSVHANWFGGTDFELGESGSDITIDADSIKGSPIWHGALVVSSDVTVTGNVVPSTGAAHDLGSADADWDSLFVDDVDIDANLDVGGEITAGTVVSDWIPTNATYDLGSATADWDSIFADDMDLDGNLTVGGSTIFGGDVVPSSGGAYDLGSADADWDSLFVDDVDVDANLTVGGVLYTDTITDVGNDGDITITVGGDIILSPSGNDIKIAATDNLYFDGGTDTYIEESAGDVLDIYVGAANMIKLTEAATDLVAIAGNTTVTGTFNVTGTSQFDDNVLPDASQGANIGASGTEFNLVWADSVHANWFGGSDFEIGESGSDVTIDADSIKGSGVLYGIDYDDFVDLSADESIAGTWTFNQKIVGQADSLDGYDSADFAVLSEAETIAGEWTFQDTVNVDDELILDDVGTNVNSPMLILRGDDGGVEEEAVLQLVQGADPYLRISVDSSNTQGLCHVIDIHDQVIAFAVDNQTDIGAAADNRPKDIFAAGDVGVGNDVLMADAGVVGITGNEVITFNAGGTIVVSGAILQADAIQDDGNDATLSFSGTNGIDVVNAFTAGTVTSDAGVGGTIFTASDRVYPADSSGASIGDGDLPFRHVYTDTVYAHHFGGRSPLSLGGRDWPVTILGDLQVNGQVSVLSPEGKRVQIDLYQLALALEEQTGRDIVVEKEKSLMERIKSIF